MDDTGGLIGLVVILAIVALVVYVAVLAASAFAMVAAIGGTAWGGGTAVLNYGKSFKKNMIDSNRSTSAAE